MARHERLIGFLDKEAQFLRERIAHLRDRQLPGGVTTGDSAPGSVSLSIGEHELKLAEIEDHLRELRREVA